VREELGLLSLSSSRFEGDLPAAHARTLWRARLWPTKDRVAYEKMIRKQVTRRERPSRREDPNSVACPHRLTFAWSGDASVGLGAQHLAMVCTCENLSDWSGLAGRAVGGSAARSVFLALQTELRDAWLSLRGQIARDEHVGAPVISAIFDLLQVYLDRQYARYALVLPPGRLREEVLASSRSPRNCGYTLRRSTSPWRTVASARFTRSRPGSPATATSPC
jgi:hypothetical protein